MRKICDAAKKSGITAIIASDIAVLQYAHSIGLEIHISTQLNVSNIEAVRFFAAFADVIVLARELTLEQIAKIVKQIKKEKITGPSGDLVRVELFAHGALCVSISGKCYMSLSTRNFSANRGACLQNCRRSYRVIDEASGEELVLENKYVMSPKDLCTIGFLDKLLGAGVKVLKIEGRGRSPDYVHVVTKCYREAADAVANKTYTNEKIEEWTKELSSVFNRGFWHGGYYLGKKLGEWSGSPGSQASKQSEYVGKVTNYFRKTGIGEFLVEAGVLRVGDELLITGETTGVIKLKLASMLVNDLPASEAKKGDVVTFSLPERVRRSDKLAVLKDRNSTV
jgi:putative protease